MERLLTWQWSRRRTLTPSTKRVSHRRSFTERCGYLQSAVSSILNAKLTGRKNLVGKGAQATGMTASLRILSAKLIQTLVRASQGVNWSWESVHQESPRSDVFRKRATSHFWTRDNVRSVLPGLWRKELDCCSVVQSPLFIWSKFAISFGNKGPRVWRKSGEATESMLLEVQCEGFHSQWWFGLPCHLLGWSTVFSEVHSQRSHSTGNFRALHASFCWQALWKMLISFSSRIWHLPTLQRYQKLVNDHGVTVLDWPANSPDLNPIENLWGIVKRKMRDTRPNNADDLKAAIKATWLPYHLSSATTDHLHATPNWGSN